MIEPLGSWQLIKSSFALWLRFIAPFTLLAMLPAALLLLLEFAPDVIEAVTQYSPEIRALELESEGRIATIVIFFVLIISSTLSTALVVPAVVDASQGKTLRFLFYIKHSIIHLPMLLLVLLFAIFRILFGFIPFVLPGLFRAAAYSIIIPAGILERYGLGTIWRCWEITDNYRGAILAFMLFVFLLFIIIAYTFSSLVMTPLIIRVIDLEAIDVWSLTAISVIAMLPLLPIPATITTLLYLRLREIKEGVTAEQITLD